MKTDILHQSFFVNYFSILWNYRQCRVPGITVMWAEWIIIVGAPHPSTARRQSPSYVVIIQPGPKSWTLITPLLSYLWKQRSFHSLHSKSNKNIRWGFQGGPQGQRQCHITCYVLWVEGLIYVVTTINFISTTLRKQTILTAVGWWEKG